MSNYGPEAPQLGVRSWGAGGPFDLPGSIISRLLEGSLMSCSAGWDNGLGCSAES